MRFIQDFSYGDKVRIAGSDDVYKVVGAFSLRGEGYYPDGYVVAMEVSPNDWQISTVRESDVKLVLS